MSHDHDEWREQLGIQVMQAMTCTHEGDAFGPRAVCVTCFDNTQRIGALIEHAAATAWDEGRELQRRVMALDTAWVRRQESEIHNACEGHALCDLISSIEALQRKIREAAQ